MRTRAAGSPEALLELYLKHLDARRFSPSTRALSRLVLLRFFSHLRDRQIRDVRAVRLEHVTAFARVLLQQRSKAGGPLSDHTRATFLSRVRAFFGFLEARGVLLTSPARGLLVRGVKRLPRCTLNPRMAEKLMSEPNPWSTVGKRDRAILEVLYGTGLRVNECARLDLLDVDLSQGTLLVRDGKGRKDRVIPVPGHAARSLEVYLSDSRPELAWGNETALFVSKYGRRVSVSSLRTRVCQYARDAQLKARVSPHALRHAYATHLLQGGADVRHVQELLGHKRIETTARYTRVEISDLKAMLARSHPRERSRQRRARQ